ncbi:tryptophan 2,3-dioxygenase family protein [Ferruginibacter paludis]|uniref:tryptophan 2,3-dioxygenase n=1 Tax=Ferruginibacter paludis TaxID=1310417 RepID=UPI0025B5A826|nr:tryptophan 2,3-dioxygenase family protein [Ferruginibacter paludis]MDN3655021.1 tryptophan 2,3-dioxygenase family protein [Ferruginibacter paludis]
MQPNAVHYADYLELTKLLNAQHPESSKNGAPLAHDEMLFIIIHQTYELWFKQILFEVDSVLAIMHQPVLDDNAADMQTVVHRLKRVGTILKILVQQVDIIETMTPMDFLDFRDMLRPASGFQSWQFKILEAKLGMRFEDRHGKAYYTSQLYTAEITLIKEAENAPSLMMLLNRWLERMPFLTDLAAWTSDKSGSNNDTGFFATYEAIYTNSLAEAEKNNIAFFKETFYDEPKKNHRHLTATACRNALFIMLYRGYPLLELPFQLLETLLEIDHQLGNWRHRHINMVQRMIGTRIGTGGSTGAGYLKAAMDTHIIFKEIAQLNSFLVDRRKLPALPTEISIKLGYSF